MNDRNETYRELRSRYPEFIYQAYHYDLTEEGLKVWFDFRMGDVAFRPEALIERKCLDESLLECLSADASNTQAIDRMVFDIGMIELISYWKCACPPAVIVLCGSLTADQISFWKKLYWNGLGEFFYTNGIAETLDAFLHLESLPLQNEPIEGENNNFNFQFSIFLPASQALSTAESKNNPAKNSPNSYLVPIGGGKDSVVTLELLRRAGKTIRPLIMNPRGATRECARVAGFPIEEVLVIRRKIDPTLLDLNAKGFLNGHTPFSAMLAFYSRLASALSGIPNVALSNENSASESTVKGSYVNHQYSKSLEFEDDFRNYCADASATNTLTHSHINAFNYFSFLRPLSELQIAMLFSRFTAYHDVFRSCNVGSKEDIWCGHCAKCLFAYIILSPFIEPARLNQIFGKSMLDDLTLQHEFKQLIGQAETKPFECVGTIAEVRQALAMTLQRWYPSTRPALLNLPLANLDKLVNLDKLAPIGNLTEEERQILQTACTDKTN